MINCDFLVIGAGYSGATLANLIASRSDKKVLVVDKKRYVGGHSSDYYNRHGVLVHRHGPHYFRTNSRRVFNYLSSFASWKDVRYIVRAYVDGIYYPFPINRDTLNILYKVNLKTDRDALVFIEKIRSKINSPGNFKEEILSRMGEDIYDKFFKNYTKKQWGIDPTKISPSVAKRIPIRATTNDSYVDDKIQAMPKGGYSRLIGKMLKHKNIDLKLGTDYKSIINSVNYKFLIHTGCIDEFYNYKFGRLPYRSLSFKHETHKIVYYQKWVQVNYPNEHKYTRIVEIKHITGQKIPITTIVKEYPRSKGDPYYPLSTERGSSLYKSYERESKKEKNIFFIGRLAEYKYINMDQAVENAMNLYDESISKLIY